MDVPSVTGAPETAAAQPKAKAASSKAFASALKKAEETTTPVKGHPFWKSLDGPHKGKYVNDSGNARDGQWFDRVRRDGRVFHVYASGDERVVVEIKRKDPGKGSGGAGAPATSS